MYDVLNVCLFEHGRKLDSFLGRSDLPLLFSALRRQEISKFWIIKNGDDTMTLG